MYSLARRIALGGALLLFIACSSPGSREDHAPAAVERPAPTWANESETVVTRQEKIVSAATPKQQVAVLPPELAEQARAEHKQALRAATPAPLEGSEIGYYVDILEARLIQLGRKTPISITRDGNRITLKLPGTGTFDSNRSSVLPDARKTLTSLAAVLEEYQKSLVSIHGHTDDAGEGDYNQKLSERRALAVAHLLIKAGVGRERIAVVGYGESQPVASNETAEGRAANRRIEFILEPLAEESHAPV